VTGSEGERIAALNLGKTDLTIINRENLGWLRNTVGVYRWPYDWLIYDEISRLKAGRKRSKPKMRADGSMPPKRLTELGVIQSVRHRINKIIGLSGTPSPNGLIDLWGPIYAIDKGARLGESMTAFKDRWFKEDHWTKKIEPFPHSEKEIMSAISDVFFSLREDDYLSLPPLVQQDHKVILSPFEMQKYRDFERDMAMRVVNRMGDNEIIRAVNGGVLTQKLLQFANGSIYLGDKFDEMTGDKLPKESVKIHEHKLDVLESIMTEAMGASVLVAYSFQFDKDAIRRRFPYVRVYGETSSDMRDWNAGKIRMLLMHPASAGHGLNFQHGSNIAVWYGLTWSLELYRQFIKRLHRSGQKHNNVYLHRIITRGTADEDILPVLVARGVTQDAISDRVRVRLMKAAA
jgi:SNF2 family DNA or RNA helicase